MKRNIIRAGLLGVIGSLCVASLLSQDNTSEKVFYVAGGCFWCVESDFEKLDGISHVESGYVGEGLEHPTYKAIGKGKGRYREAARIFYDSSVISYKQLVDFFYRTIDPLDDGGQFCDRGFQYSTAIYYTNEEERAISEKYQKQFSKQLDETLSVALEPLTIFTLAEDYHQDYYKNPSYSL